MTNYLLDTNHLSPLVTIGHPLRVRFSYQQRMGDTFAVTVPAITELLYGIQILPRAQQNIVEWTRLRAGLTIYDLDYADASEAAELQLQLRRRGWQLVTVDALIAAIALRYDLTLLTTDKDFSSVPNLKQDNWLTP